MSFVPPVATGYSPFFDPALARPGNGAEADYNSIGRYGRGSIERLVSHALAKPGYRAMRRVMRVLNGAAPGSLAAETYARVQAANGDFVGGARVVEVVTLQNANTTAPQQLFIQNRIIDNLFAQSPASYPVDASGNGGGNKLSPVG